MISDEDKEKVRQATDFVQLVGETVNLRQRGNEFWGCCPFHGEKTPSFKVNPQTGLWHCFGCSSGGDVFNYVQKRENLEFSDAVRYLADRAGITLSEEKKYSRGPRKNRLIECLTEAENFFHLMLMRGRGEGSAAARAYLSGRGFGGDVCKRWKLGYAPGRGSLVAHLREKGFTEREMIAANLAIDRNGRTTDWFYDRVMFPIHDERGRTIAFGGRVLVTAKNAPKYLNTRDTAVFNKGKHLFAYDRAKETMAATGTAIVCEGYTDVIAMHEAGFTNAVAALGTAFRLDHVKLLERQRVKKIICMFDGDSAGQRAASRSVQFIDKTSAAFLCVVLPDNQDPMEFLAAHGAEALQAHLDQARPLMDFVFESKLGEFDLSTPGSRVAALHAMAEILAPLKKSVLLDEYALRLADALGVNVNDAKRIIRETPIQEIPEPNRSNFQPTPAESRTRQDGASRQEVSAPPAPPDTALQSLSHDDRMQLQSERELLSAMAARIDTVRTYGKRIAELSWVDSRHEAMAWAMLATPKGTPAPAVIAAAQVVEPTAPQVLSGGKVFSAEGMSEQEKLNLIVNTLEFFSLKRKMRELRRLLQRSASEETAPLLRQISELQKQINEAGERLSAN
ncbi:MULTISPECIES: DNA primase [Atopobiaceae]|uniref:DNA primase n=1 Tax=Atopobiaceae TaxID=1643824 RepID=UPI00034EB0CB|nr:MULTISPECIES: DNA primase [Atopobiaceae]EPD78158.1 DNA primase [Atopobium sp. oral taxon 199 str. F0494]